jgi:DNA polymerase V
MHASAGFSKNPPSSCFAIIDGNNFFVSCERVFDPSLNNKPVIVLSNNDGCAISRSNEAKLLGIPMEAPLHTFAHLIKPYDIKIFSSNFELYGDLSNRMMRTLQTFTSDIEIYSIDEAFLNLPPLHPKEYHNLANTLVHTVLKHVGIPVTVGIAPTKTLAKVANRASKKQKKPFSVLLTVCETHDALKLTDIGDVWGIGRNLTIKLKQLGIYTAYDLARKDPRWARKVMTVTGERLVRELQGLSCIPLSPIEPDRHSIQVTRSFGRKLRELEGIAQAVSSHATRLGEKLRVQKLVTPAITVFCRTSPFSNTPYYKGISTIEFEEPTNDTALLIKGALQALRQAFKEGFIYQKAGIHAHGLVPQNSMKQKKLFENDDDRTSIKKCISSEKQHLNASIDKINQRFGKDTVFWASSGLNPPHVMKQNQRSPRYTTQWQELKWVN